MSVYRQIWLSCPQPIITALGITGLSVDVPGWIKFTCEVAEIQYNFLAESAVKGGFGRAISAPVARQKGYSLTVRESRYGHYLAIARLAALSDSAVLNGQSAQLITMRDFVAPEYDQYVAAIVGQTSPFTDRVGYIPSSSVKISATVNACGLNHIRSAAPIQFQFMESSPGI